MKVKHLKLIIFSLVCVFVMGYLFMNINDNLDVSPKENKYIQKNDYYTIKEYQGKIAVFINEEPIPIDIYEVYVYSLPAHDRENLSKGFRVENVEDLQRIIEDYTS